MKSLLKNIQDDKLTTGQFIILTVICLSVGIALATFGK